MKSHWFGLLLLCSSCSFLLSTETEVEQIPLMYTDYEGIGSLRPWSDGGLVAAVTRTRFNTFEATPKWPRVSVSEMLLIKTDTAGTVQWQKVIGLATSTYMGPLMETLPAGGAYVLYSVGTDKFALTKVSRSGDVVWSQPVNLPVSARPLRLHVSQNGEPLMSGDVRSVGVPAIFAARFDAEGRRRWLVEFPATPPVSSRLFCGMEATVDGGMMITGTDLTYTPAGRKTFLIALDSEGNKRWEQTYPITVTNGYNIRQTTDGGFLLAGIAGINGPLQVLKTTETGLAQELKTYALFNVPSPVALFLRPNGQRVVVGSHADFPQRFTLILGAQGDLLNEVRLTPSIPRYAPNGQSGDVTSLSDGSLVYLMRRLNNFDEIILEKTDRNGQVVWTKIIAKNTRP